MSSYYPDRRYGQSIYGPMFNHDEYSGYDTTWVLGRNRLSGYDDDYYQGNYYSPGYSSYDYHPRFASMQPYHGRSSVLLQDGMGEIPLRLRATICCQQCKMKLSKALRKMHGVHDVVISGREPAMVTVTGTASARKILNKVRNKTLHADWAIDSAYPIASEYSVPYTHNRHQIGWTTAY